MQRSIQSTKSLTAKLIRKGSVSGMLFFKMLRNGGNTNNPCVMSSGSSLVLK